MSFSNWSVFQVTHDDFCSSKASKEEYGAAETLNSHFWYAAETAIISVFADWEGVGVGEACRAQVQLDMFKTLALFNGSFSAHYNAPTYYAELHLAERCEEGTVCKQIVETAYLWQTRTPTCCFYCCMALVCAPVVQRSMPK